MTRLLPSGTVRQNYAPDAPAYLESLSHAVAMSELPNASAAWAYELTRFQSDLSEEEQHDVAVLILMSLIAMRDGSTRLPLRGEQSTWLMERVAAFVEDPVAWHRRIEALLQDALPQLVSTGNRTPLVTDGDWLYHQRILHYETRFAEFVRRRMTLGLASDPSDALNDIQARPAGGIVPDADQLRAVVAASTRPLSVITGGPGTGKTSIVVSVLRVLLRQGLHPDQIALAAPTGKAANRLGEAIDGQIAAIEDPSPEDEMVGDIDRPLTLHRLLRYSRRSGQFFHNVDNPLPYRWVIVDEASMIDLVLMERLIESLRDDAHIVLLGDAEQLPSVDTGTILRDLIPEEAAPHVVRLSHSHRVRDDDPDSRRILDVADLVRQGDIKRLTAKSSPMRRCDADALSRRGVDFVELQDSPEPLRVLLSQWDEVNALQLSDLDDLALHHVYPIDAGEFSPRDHERLNRLFQRIARARVLCLTRVFTTGANAINTYFHRRLAQYAGVPPSEDFLPGEPVLVTSNDYDRGLFNGDQGVVVRAKGDDGEDRLLVVFQQGPEFRAFHLSSLRQRLDRAFAMTVHKSQGSEFDRVLVILPTESLPLLTREIIYTAITRAREHAVIVGPKAMLQAGVTARIQRFSGVRARV